MTKLLDPNIATPIALTRKQKAALALDDAGYSDAVIADRLHLKHVQSAEQLLKRARAARKAFYAAAADFIGGP